ncbi:MAG: acyl-CoA thioesterase [Candidatus Harrisonbacteria bacterium]|nr:acyl-CoA thioesterase [Candidatus Harrisonbacteria bacterium]
MKERPAKRVPESAINDSLYMIQPNDLNYLGTIFGGTVMAESDKIAAVVAKIHCGQTCVTASVDAFRFLAPAYVSEVLVFKASVNRVWNASLEVGIKVFAKNTLTGENRHIVSAYFTFVPIDETRKPVPVKYSLNPETEEEKRRWREADKRRERRLQERSKK